MLIRLTTEADLPYLDAIFDACRDYMAAQGNPTQWDANYPNSKVVAQDVIDGTGYVCVDENSVVLATSVWTKTAVRSSAPLLLVLLRVNTIASKAASGITTSLMS